MKAERPSSRDFGNAQKKTNLRSEDDTFKVQEEQRYILTLIWFMADRSTKVVIHTPA